MPGKLRLGFVGAGYMAQTTHIPNFLAVPEVEPVALAEARPKLARRAAEYFHIPRAVSSHKDIAAMDDVDAVVAIMGEAFHPKVAIDLLSAGKHVFIEKPLATSAAVGQEMVQAAEKAGKLLMVGYMKRYDEGVMRARELLGNLLADKELGEPTLVRIHCFGGGWNCDLRAPLATDEPPAPLEAAPDPDWLPEAWRGPWNPFHIFRNVYCHNLNLLRFLFNCHESDLGVHCCLYRPPTFVVTLALGDLPISMDFGQLSAHSWDEYLSVYFRDGRLDVLTPPPLLRNVSARVVVYRAGARQETHELLGPWSWGFYREAEAFVRCCLGEEQCLADGRDALEDMLLIERILQRAIEDSA